jgi:hypothetical protein
MNGEKDKTLMELFETIAGGQEVELDNGVKVTVVAGHLAVNDRWIEALSAEETEDLSRALRERASDRFLDPTNSPIKNE